jgi:hypothetical protein
MRCRPLGVIFPAVANKGGQLNSSIGNGEGPVDRRQPKGRKGGNLFISQFGRQAIDIEHLVTTSSNGENHLSCHGVWDLKDGRRVEGTLTVKTNVAGSPIAQWQQEGWEPTPNYSSGLKPKPEVLPAGKPSGPTIVPATTDAATTTSASFQDGATDRLAWETWFNGLSGEERDGAYYWAAQRSLKTPGGCDRLGGAGQVGCAEAKTRLSLSDARRKNDPDYKAGWNSIRTN